MITTRTIRGKTLLLFLLLSLGSILPVTALFYWHAKQSLMHVTQRNLNSLAVTAENTIPALKSNWEKQVDLIVSRTQMRVSLEAYQQDKSEEHLETIRSIITDALEVFGRESVITLTDKKGISLVSTDPSQKMGEQLFSAETLGMLEKAGASYALIPKEDLSFQSSRGLFLEGELIGFAQVSFSVLDDFIALEEDFRVGKGETGEIITGMQEDEDTIVYLDSLRHAGTQPLQKKASMHDPDLPMVFALQGKEGIYLKGVRDYMENDVIAVTRYIPELGIGVVAKIHKKEALAPLRKVQKELYVLIVFIFVVTLVVGIYFSRKLTSPLQTLIKAIENLASGNLNQTVPENQSTHELKIMATAFNEMIRKRKKAEEKIRLYSGKLEAVFNGAVDGIIVISGDGKVESFNKACEKEFGYEAAEVIGKNIKILMPEPYHGEHDTYLENYRKTGKKKIIGTVREVEAKRKDGSTFPVELSVSEVDAQGVRMYSGVVRNVSAQKEAEATVKRYSEQLAQRNVDLEKSNQELQHFAYVASHDLQEPLRMVSSYCELLKNRYRSKLDDNGVEFLDYAVDGALRMQTLIRALLEYSRIDRQKREWKTVSLEKVLGDVVKSAEMKIKECKAKITHDALPQVQGDSTLFSQLLQNLVGNALKFHTEKNAPNIHVSAAQEGEQWVFSVKDNGIGIDAQYKEKIFDMFKRLHTREEYEGTGIGLAMCKKIVEQHGGTIWMESELGKGTTFFFSHPTHVNENKQKEDSK